MEGADERYQNDYILPDRYSVHVPELEHLFAGGVRAGAIVRCQLRGRAREGLPRELIGTNAVSLA